MVTVKSNNKEKQEVVEVQEQSIYQHKKPMEVIKKEIKKETKLGAIKKDFTSMNTVELETQLNKFIEAVKVIKKKMIAGEHYIDIGAEKPIITKQGTAWLAAATNMNVRVEETKEIIKPESELILYQHKATASWGKREAIAYGTANSQEANQKAKYTGTKSRKSVYDTINDVLQMSQKRARGQAIRELLAMTNMFDTNEDNPKAKEQKRRHVYITFYKHFMKYCPEAPKKKKGKVLDEKARLEWKKEHLKAKYFTPKLFEMGFPSYNDWGIKDVEQLEKDIPNWPKQMNLPEVKQVKQNTSQKENNDNN